MSNTTDMTGSDAPARSLGFVAPDGYVLGYHVVREAWYQPTTSVVDPSVLCVGLFGLNGGGRWEFSIDQMQAGGNALRIGVYDDAWQAFTDIPEVFAALGEEIGRGALVEEVTGILDEFGFRDLTARTNPHA